MESLTTFTAKQLSRQNSAALRGEMRIIDQGIISQGEPRTVRAMLTFPGLAALSNGELLLSYRRGSRKECDDNTIEMRRSRDNGLTWDAPTEPFASPQVRGKRGSLSVCYITEHSPGRLLAALMWVDRDSYPGQGLFNAETQGCLPMAILLTNSDDFGATWSTLREIPVPAEIGPPSLTNPVLAMPDGTLAISIESNKHYLDASKWYQKVVLLHSTDGGFKWNPPIVAGCDPTGRIHNWDQRACVSPEWRIATFLWTYDSETEAYLNIHRRVSDDNGHTWSKAEDLGITDQPSHPAVLPDGRVVLAWVDRFQTATIRARLANTLDAPFDPGSELVIYRHGDSSRAAADGALGLSPWSFGLPFAEALPDGDVLVVYYAGDDVTLNIRYARIRVLE